MRVATRNSLIALAVASVIAGAVLAAVFLLRKKEGYDETLTNHKYYKGKLRGMQRCHRHRQCNSGRCENGRCACKYPKGSNTASDGTCLPGYAMNRCGGCMPQSVASA